MSGKAMILKAKIRNLARKKDMSAQVVLQNFMFERFLERLSKSEYREKLILKGGMLIAALIGIDNRTTMDLDTTIKNHPFNVESLTKVVKEICSIEIDDDIKFTFTDINTIRDDDPYGGFRVSIISDYDTIKTPMQIDITVGDAITPKEVLYQFSRIFEDGSFSVLAYNVETILAEKIETILRRGEFNTRPRDFYDVYILAKTQIFDRSVFLNAVKSTAMQRGTTHIFINMSNRLEEISASEALRYRWSKYTVDYKYANGIKYDDIMETIGILLQKNT